MAGEVGKRASEFAAGSAWVLVQVVLTFFVSGIGVKPLARCVRSSRSRKRRLIKYSLGWRTPFMPPSSARSRSLGARHARRLDVLVAWITRADPLGRSDGAASNRSGSRRLRRLAPRGQIPRGQRSMGQGRHLAPVGHCCGRFDRQLALPDPRRKTIASAYRSGVFRKSSAASLYSAQRGSFLGPSSLRSLTPFWKSGDAARRRADQPKKLPEARGSSANAVAFESIPLVFWPLR
jgi:hypothetical protein